jgi:hypothetical protein
VLTGPKTHLTIEQFAARLAPVLGSEQALLTVRAGARAIDRDGELLAPEDQRSVLRWLGAQTGVVAAAARHLLRKFDGTGSSGVAPAVQGASETLAASGTRSVSVRPAPAPTSPLDTSTQRSVRSAPRGSLEDALRADMLELRELVEMFAGATGHERAKELIERAVAVEGAAGPTVPRSVAIKVLEGLASEPGVVGVVARFAKARIALKPR